MQGNNTYTNRVFRLGMTDCEVQLEKDTRRMTKNGMCVVHDENYSNFSKSSNLFNQLLEKNKK